MPTQLKMELALLPSFSTATRNCKAEFNIANDPVSSLSFHIKPRGQGTKISTVSCALPETVASVVLAATVVGTAATFLARRTKASETTTAEETSKACEDCGGSGICSECKGEGFVLKRLSDQTAEKARLSATNMATRYTAGLPKKWSYCTKCTSGRSCRTCGGSGRVLTEIADTDGTTDGFKVCSADSDGHSGVTDNSSTWETDKKL